MTGKNRNTHIHSYPFRRCACAGEVDPSECSNNGASAIGSDDVFSDNIFIQSPAKFVAKRRTHVLHEWCQPSSLE